MKKKNRPGRKLLVASLGVAAVTYACSSGSGGGSGGGGSGGVVGNLVGPDPDAAVDGATDAGSDKFSEFDQVANLVPPDFDASQ